MSNRVVAYCSTRNLYPRLPTVINSLLTNTPTISRVYVFAEDDRIGSLRDERIQVVNVTKLPLPFDKGSPNYRSPFTYMAMLRCIFNRVLNEDRVLYLDVDTIVCDDIGQLFDVDLTGSPVAGVADIALQDITKGYINSGVLLMNLKLISELKLDDKMVEGLNAYQMRYPDQDIINVYCRPITLVPREYNMFVTHPLDEPKIIHYAGIRKWWESSTPYHEYYEKYRCVSV